MSGAGYRAPERQARAELREKGSRFLAIVIPVADAEAARRELAAIRSEFADATHHCFAWRVGGDPEERVSDAGEPTGTAGAPMLRVLRGAELSDVLAVVARWFGGVKLGKGGLARAYSGAVRAAIAELPIVERRPTVLLEVQVPYDRLGAVQSLVHPPAVRIAERAFGVSAHLVLEVEEARLGEVEEALADRGLRSGRRT